MKLKTKTMKKSNNIISDWLEKYGNPEIEKQVEEEIKNINKIDAKIKEYCKNHKLKFEKYIQGGFIASRLVDIKAGMEYDMHSGKLTSIPIRKIGNKRVYRKYICYPDGDIVDDGVVQNYR